MKVVILSNDDLKWGAGKAAYRLHQGLQKHPINSHFLVQNKLSDDDTVIAPKKALGKAMAKIRPTLNSLPLQLFYPEANSSMYCTQWLPDTISKTVAQFSPDLINLHNITLGYVQIETLARFKCPLVWTLHDMWTFTGGCHYSNGCDRYQNQCGACPQLYSQREKDLSRWIWQRKAKSWKNLNLTIVALSHWMADCIQRSSLLKDFPLEIIPNGLDLERFKPIDKPLARQLLNLPQDKPLILFGAMNATLDPRKGAHLLYPAIQKLNQAQGQDNIQLVIFGATRPTEAIEFGYPTYYLGRLNDDIALSLAYSAADVFIAPSQEDNLPNTVLEALACGTPCVAFKIGGIPDLIEHQKNGYLAQPFEIEDLTRGIDWVLKTVQSSPHLSLQARQKVETQFNQLLQVNRYHSLFKKLIQS
ncbi:MAG: glycosyltransferase family 4 protein [Snowella sp.]|nr:glycosyltransferase family 4 protein [Snowella sp.]